MAALVCSHYMFLLYKSYSNKGFNYQRWDTLMVGFTYLMDTHKFLLIIYTNFSNKFSRKWKIVRKEVS